MNATALFIGGPCDGLRKYIVGQPERFEVEATPEEDGLYRTLFHVYRREHLYGGNGQTFVVYVHEYNTADTLALLIEGYRGRAS